jgi:hypothetical protein
MLHRLGLGVRPFKTLATPAAGPCATSPSHFSTNPWGLLCGTQVMSDKEMAWVDAYHRQVWEALSPRLSGEELEWLREATSPL